jgi:DNA polymerase III subunit gamma/tau
VAQTIGGAGQRDEPFVATLAKSLPPETTQLYYQIVLLGIRDLHLAPDPQCGFEMVMMRLLAFEPLPPLDEGRATDHSSAEVHSGAGDRARPAPPAGPRSAVSVPYDDPAISAAGKNWFELVAGLKLSGVGRMIAEHSVPVRIEGSDWELCLDAAHDTLLNEAQVRAIGRALGDDLRQAVTLRILPGSPPAETPAERSAREQREQYERAVATLQQDRHVRTLIEEFDAELNLDSVRQVQPKG